MSNKKPNTFETLTSLSGDEYVFTQTGGVSEKINVELVKNYILNNLDAWSYKEVIMTPADMNLFTTVKFQLLDETELGENEYYEVNRLVFEVIPGESPVANDSTNSVWIGFKTSPYVPITGVYPVNILMKVVPTSIIGATTEMVYVYYLKRVPREIALVDTKPLGLYLDCLKDIGSGTVSYKIKIYYKKRIKWQ